MDDTLDNILDEIRDLCADDEEYRQRLIQIILEAKSARLFGGLGDGNTQ